MSKYVPVDAQALKIALKILKKKIKKIGEKPYTEEEDRRYLELRSAYDMLKQALDQAMEADHD